MPPLGIDQYIFYLVVFVVVVELIIMKHFFFVSRVVVRR